MCKPVLKSMDSIVAALRPSVAQSQETDLVFQILDVQPRDVSVPTFDATTDDVLCDSAMSALTAEAQEEAGVVSTAAAVVYLFGVTATGASVCAIVSGFRPWFFAELPTLHANASHAGRLQTVLDQKFRLPVGDIVVSLERRHRLYGWAPDEADPAKRRLYWHARISFPNVRIARFAASFLEKTDVDIGLGGRVRLSLADAKVDPSQKFLAAAGIRACGWVQVKQARHADARMRASHCQVEVACDLQELRPRVDRDGIAPLLVASTDIEVDSRTGEFPHALCDETCAPGCPGDEVIFVGVSFWVYGEEKPKLNVMLCLRDVAPVPGVELLCFQTELELLVAYRDLLVRTDPDWCTGYNVTAFDFKYIWERQARLLGPRFSRFPYLSRLAADPCTLKVKELSSAGTGDNSLAFFAMLGRVITDMFMYVKTSQRLSSYTLDAVAREFLGDATQGKLTLDVPGWARAATAAARSAIVSLVGSTHAAAYMAESAVATFDAAESVVAIAEQSMWLRTLEEEGAEEEEDAAGLHQAHPAHELLVKATEALVGVVGSGNEAMKTSCIVREALVATGNDNYKKLFAINRMDAASRAAIVAYAIQDCALVLQLMSRLSTVPNMVQMAFVTHTLLNDIGNRGQQIKVYNQLYRFASPLGFVMNPPNCGWPEDQEYQGAHVIPPEPGFYRDPVITLDFASLYPSIMRNENLCPSTLVLDPSYLGLPGVRYKSHPISGKDWTFVVHDKGIMPSILESLLDARKAAKTEMKKFDKESLEYRLLDGRQLALKVSANSVYGFNGVAKNGMYACMPVAAAVTGVGRDMILRTKAFVETTYMHAKVIYGDSVAGDTPLIVRAAGCIQTCRMDELIPAAEWAAYHGTKEAGLTPGLEVWSDSGFTPVRRVIRHACGKALTRVVTGMGVVDCTEDHSLLKPDGSKASPLDLTCGNALLHAADAELMSGLGGAGTRGGGNNRGNTRSKNLHGENRVPPCLFYAPLEDVRAYMNRVQPQSLHLMEKEYLTGLWLLYRRLGTWPRLQYTKRGMRIKISTDHKNLPAAADADIVSMEQLPCTAKPDYVYDLETDSHHFHVGPGNLVVHNTDSIMCTFGPMTMAAAFSRGLDAAKGATALFPGGIVKLEFEKVYMPYALYKKKNYAAMKYEGKPTDPPKMDVKGIAVVRRDNCAIVRQVLGDVLRAMLQDGDAAGAYAAVESMLQKLQHDQVPLSDYVITKALRAPEKYKDQHHEQLVVRKKLMTRKAFDVPRPGDRVPFIISCEGGAKICDRAEHPSTPGVKVDRLYYLNNQLRKPIEKIMDGLPVPSATALLDHTQAQLERERDGIGSLSSLFGGVEPVMAVSKKRAAPRGELPHGVQLGSFALATTGSAAATGAAAAAGLPQKKPKPSIVYATNMKW